MAGEIKISHPHPGRSGEHVDIIFGNDRRPGQQVLPFPKLHVPAPCQPDFNPLPGWNGRK